MAPRDSRSSSRRRRRRGTVGVLIVVAALLLLAVAPDLCKADADGDDDGKTTSDEADPRALFERPSFQLPDHLRAAARADLGGVEFYRQLYEGSSSSEEKRDEGRQEKKKKKRASSSSSTSSTSSTSTAAVPVAVPPVAAAPGGDQLVKVMVVQPDAQQMAAIMRGEQVK